MGTDSDTVSEIYDCVESRNFVSLNNILDKIGKNQYTDCIRELPRYFGDLDVIEKAKEIATGSEGQKSLEYLGELYIQLEKMGLADKVIIDLSLVNRTNYYTGIIFKGYLQGSGVCVVSGGRYDSLLSEFGNTMPSTGFGIETGALASVMISRGEVDEEILPKILAWGEDGYVTDALEYSRRLRESGIYCETGIFTTFDETLKYAKSKGIETIYRFGENGMSEEKV